MQTHFLFDLMAEHRKSQGVPHAARLCEFPGSPDPLLASRGFQPLCHQPFGALAVRMALSGPFRMRSIAVSAASRNASNCVLRSSSVA